MSDFRQVAALLKDWPVNGLTDVTMETSLGVRIRAAIRSLLEPDAVHTGPLDLAGLMSQLVRRETLQQRDPKVSLRVPRAEGWPTQVLWERCLCDIARTTTHYFVIEGRPWRPQWLSSPDDRRRHHAGGDKGLRYSDDEDRPDNQQPLYPADPLHPALVEELRRPDEAVRADPAIEGVLGFKQYHSPGQRMAVRSALLLQPGGTLLVVLPTGGGKSLAVFASALLQGVSDGLTLVLVPTVALALDQARRARELFKGRPEAKGVETWAYHSGLDPQEKKALLRRIHDGMQPIVYASPEAAMYSLRSALLHAARAGRLRTFVIDEAHLVAQWGTEFRPEFQALAGLRRTLRAECEQHSQSQFRTLLLTATLTNEAWWTLKTLFGDDGEIEVCASVSLRAEPDFYLTESTVEERIERVTELAHVLPRPFILYTTTRQDCDDWAGRLESAGLRRSGKIHGGTPTAERERVLSKWIEQELDVMVATSAFGLGMDQSDVRAVVHACVPETIDRFYQEVGRGGRDGKASLSFLVHTPSDLKLAESLSRDRIISVDKGLDRWSAMHRNAEHVGHEGSLLVRLDTKPAAIQRDSDANVAWNLRTLILMARAGLLTLEAHTPPDVAPREGETENAFASRRQAAFDAYKIRARVLPANSNHLSRDVWNDLVQGNRLANNEAEEQANQQLLKLLSGNERFSTLFGSAYRVPDAGIVVGASTLSCPATRRAGLRHRAGYGPAPRALKTPICELGPSLARVVGTKQRVFVSLNVLESASTRESKKLQRRILRLMERLVMDGLREFSTPDTWLRMTEYRRLFRHAQPRLVLHTSQDGSRIAPLDEALPVPRLTLLWPPINRNRLEEALEWQCPLHLILLPEDLPDLSRTASFISSDSDHLGAVRSDRAFLDTRPHLTFSDFERRLGY